MEFGPDQYPRAFFYLILIYIKIFTTLINRKNSNFVNNNRNIFYFVNRHDRVSKMLAVENHGLYTNLKSKCKTIVFV